MERTKDTKEDVRKYAFEIISKKINYKVLTISQRITLIREGLKDRYTQDCHLISHYRSERVRDACADMLCTGWLENKEENVTTLLAALDVEEYEEVVELALKVICSKIRITATFDTENLTPESAILWRTYFTHLKEQKVCSSLRVFSSAKDNAPHSGALSCALEKTRRN